VDKIRVVLVDRINSAQSQGGDTVQIRAIQKFLIEAGMDATVTADLQQWIERTDVVILFNLTNPFELFYNYTLTRKAGLPYLVFPIYWNLDEAIPPSAYVGSKQILRRMIPATIKHSLRLFLFYRRHKDKTKGSHLFHWLSLKRYTKEILMNAAFVCVNSEAERTHLIDTFKLPEPCRHLQVIKNGFSPAKEEEMIDQELLRFIQMDYVCSVGGIGPRKNQLNLIRAANRLQIPLLVIGKASPENREYDQQLREEAGDSVHFLGHLNREQVQWVMKHAKGHIQPSYIETPGLASLEAISLGCPIGVSDVGPVKEYFDGHAVYCDPASIESIADCLTQLLKKDQVSIELQQYFRSNYSWEMVLKPLTEHIERSHQRV